MDPHEVIENLTTKYPDLALLKDNIANACEALTNSFHHQGKLLVCGNGGSCSDADHIVGELMKSFEKKRSLKEDFVEKLMETAPKEGPYIAEKLENAVPAISLNAHAALITAIANDIDADLIFAQQIVGYGQKGDVFLGITTSGNSKNVVNAAIAAKAKGLIVVALTGKTGGALKQFSDIAICAPADNTADVQEYHLPIYHTICKYVENSFFD
ncbi:SIS domain-containing protein [Fulvivirgaceae bacterium BMA12]|uniref:SIS domain-containing protein n=1 Tax=Agaribacillus aureus TaxID=3051825 RepID=A0ABT8LGX8_9BACT|nr:SIS domain-containing protein [Fulvivirgaceae bacterium BMA12]